MAGTNTLTGKFSKSTAGFNTDSVDADALQQELKQDKDAAKYVNMNPKEVLTVYNLLCLKQNDPEKYAEKLEYGDRCTKFCDDPRLQ